MEPIQQFLKSNNMEIFGWLSTIFFTLAGFPQAIKTIKEKNARGISNGFFICWFLGNLCGAFYAVFLSSIPMAISFLTTLGFALIIAFFKIKDHFSK